MRSAFAVYHLKTALPAFFSSAIDIFSHEIVPGIGKSFVDIARNIGPINRINAKRNAFRTARAV